MAATALIVAAGSGTRLGAGVPKQYRQIAGKPVLRWAVEAMTGHPSIASVRVVIGQGQQDLAATTLRGLDVGDFIQGGAERADSVRAGLAALDADAVLVHDAARPFCPPAVIDRLIPALEFFEGAAPVLAIGDTLARADGDLRDAVSRDGLVRVQTPQAFRLSSLRAAYAQWKDGVPTDETTVVRAAGMRVAAVQGDPMLDKLTTAADWQRAEAAICGRLVPRTGMGFDVHAFEGPGPIILGGVAVQSNRGLAGHSDADVVLHAITDALLGAAALGDIGQHFPPSDPQWKDASSDRFLSFAAEQVRARGGLIDHVDCTIICEEPRVGPYRERITERVAEILDLPAGSVSIKATTTERLGFTGRGEGIAAQAVVNIRMGIGGQ
jgi:2-C-methyl-D-erythritol 4-phosphate cytidylyltransferase/2-C-methyl-D-erythritol 2,4-cyclodiphosphate synthase